MDLINRKARRQAFLDPEDRNAQRLSKESHQRSAQWVGQVDGASIGFRIVDNDNWGWNFKLLFKKETVTRFNVKKWAEVLACDLSNAVDYWSEFSLAEILKAFPQLEDLITSCEQSDNEEFQKTRIAIDSIIYESRVQESQATNNKGLMNKTS